LLRSRHSPRSGSAAGYQASQDLSADALGLLVLASVPAVIAALVELKSLHERGFFREEASGFRQKSFEKLFDISASQAGVESILARFGSEGGSDVPRKSGETRPTT
jgi:hypothetical protein